MANNHGTHPYSNGNPRLKNEMDGAVREAMEGRALPSGDDGNASGENGSHFDDGYSWYRRVANLEGEVFRLRDELKSLKEKCRNGLYVFEGKRLLQNFEENLALYLYPRGWVFGKSEIFPNLMNWLNVRRGTLLGEIPNTKWSQVKHDLPWNPQHEEVLAKFRNLLPDISQPIEMWNLVSLSNAEVKCIEDLNDLSRRLTQLIEMENEKKLCI